MTHRTIIHLCLDHLHTYTLSRCSNLMVWEFCSLLRFRQYLIFLFFFEKTGYIGQWGTRKVSDETFAYFILFLLLLLKPDVSVKQKKQSNS